MKVTLIQPPKPTYGADAETQWSLVRPFSLFYLASSLRYYLRCQVQIIDLEQSKYRGSALENIFKNNESQVFGITATTYTRFEAIKIAEYIKSVHPFSFVIVGGVHFMYCAKDVLKKISAVDIVVRGEGEATIVELVNSIDAGRTFENIKGISYRSNAGEIIENPDREIFNDFDSIPAYAEFSWEEYPEYLFSYPERIRAISIMSSRGCPYGCIFCAKAGMKYRLRAPKKVVEEMESYKERFGIGGVNFLDLTFTADYNHVRALCDEMIKRNIALKWWCESRVNIPLKLLDLMKQAGCISLAVGIESGSSKVLSRISKGISNEQAVAFCRKCSDIGIGVTAYFTFSHPEETKEDVLKTLSLMDSLKNYTLSRYLQPMMIFPGTQLEKIAYEKEILPENFSWCESYGSTLNTDLGQLFNVPLFLDRLNPHELKYFMKMKRLKEAATAFATLGFKESAFKVLNAVRKGKVSSRYLLSPRFCFEYAIAKMKRR